MNYLRGGVLYVSWYYNVKQEGQRTAHKYNFDDEDGGEFDFYKHKDLGVLDW